MRNSKYTTSIGHFYLPESQGFVFLFLPPFSLTAAFKGLSDILVHYHIYTINFLMNQCFVKIRQVANSSPLLPPWK